MPKVNEKKYRAQKYRWECEKESWASDWLLISKRVAGKAYCSLRGKDLVAGKSALMGHAKSSGLLHQSKTFIDSCNMRSFSPQLTNQRQTEYRCSSSQEEHSFQCAGPAHSNFAPHSWWFETRERYDVQLLSASPCMHMRIWWRISKLRKEFRSSAIKQLMFRWKECFA